MYKNKNLSKLNQTLKKIKILSLISKAIIMYVKNDNKACEEGKRKIIPPRVYVILSASLPKIKIY